MNIIDYNKLWMITIQSRQRFRMILMDVPVLPTEKRSTDSAGPSSKIWRCSPIIRAVAARIQGGNCRAALKLRKLVRTETCGPIRKMVHDVHDVQLQSGRCYVLYVWHLKLAHDPWRAHYPAAARSKVRVWTAVVPFKSRVCGNWKGKNEDIMIIRWKYSQTPACQTKSCWNKGLQEKVSPVLNGQCNKLLNAVQLEVAPRWKEPIPKHGGTSVASFWPVTSPSWFPSFGASR